MRERNIKKVTILKVDTEGFDAPILYSVKSLLEAKAMDMITYEYHNMGVWPKYPLEDVCFGQV
jgi:hypothetical protein